MDFINICNKLYVNVNTYVPSSLSTGAGHSRYVSSTIRGFTTWEKENLNNTTVQHLPPEQLQKQVV